MGEMVMSEEALFLDKEVTAMDGRLPVGPTR